jgi:hypothetical protein
VFRAQTKDVVRGVQPVVRRSAWANVCRLRVGTGETLQARTAYLAPVVVPCVDRKLAGIRRRVEPPRSFAALLRALQPLSCAPQALHTPHPTLPPQRSTLAPWPLPHSSQIHRKGRRPARPPYSRRQSRGGRDAGASGWDGIRRASLSLARKGCAGLRRPGK